MVRRGWSAILGRTSDYETKGMEKDPLFQIFGFGVSLEMLLAVLALFLTMYQARQTHKHNRLSVKPILHWQGDRHRTDDELLVKFDLKNHGLGPAIVTKVEVFWQDLEFPVEDVHDPITRLIREIIGEKFSHEVVEQHIPSAKAVMRPEEEIRVAAIRFHNLPNQVEEDFIKIFDKARVVVYYDSVYGVRDYYDTDEKLTLTLGARVLRPFRAYFRNVRLGQRLRRPLSKAASND